MAYENYQVWSWVIYLLSALVVMLVTLRMTHSWPVTLKGFVITSATVLFMVPWYVQGNAGPMAPAVIITFFEALGSDQETSWLRAGLPLMAAMAVGYLLFALVLWFKRSQQSTAESVARRAESDVSEK
ncbi:hypothetical protein [Oceanospirillum maris]|uniref:hypothetical protein n=1 Tax=Oceanospirillum maris TaxID=64977 RepID=UPI0004881A5E|nr:hypothetical protein [Oceanospirillum maris]